MQTSPRNSSKQFLPLRGLIIATLCVGLVFSVSLGPAHSQSNRMVEPDVAERINKAWQAYRQQKPNKAVRLIRPLTTRTDLPPDVYMLAGKIFYDKNRFDRALNQFRTARRKNNNPEQRGTIKDLMKRARNLQELNLRSTSYSQFIILVSPDIQRGFAQRLNQDLMKAYRRIGGDLDLFPDRQFTVIVYRRPEFRRVVGAPVWSGGVFDGKIHLPYQDDSKTPYTTRSLYHEYTHALLYHIARNNLPLWFNEGFATFQEYRQSRDRFRYRRIREEHPEQRIRELNDISKLFQSQSDREQARLAYEYSYSFIDFLEERFGIIPITRVIERTGETSSFKEAIETTLNRSLESLRFAWEDWLDGELR